MLFSPENPLFEQRCFVTMSRAVLRQWPSFYHRYLWKIMNYHIQLPLNIYFNSCSQSKLVHSFLRSNVRPKPRAHQFGKLTAGLRASSCVLAAVIIFFDLMFSPGIHLERNEQSRQCAIFSIPYVCPPLFLWLPQRFRRWPALQR